jgi:transcriptional regulator with XRE-family HTH domain
MPDRTFAERLRRIIDADPDLTVAGLAVRAGLDNSALRSLLSGKSKNPRLDTAMKVCAALGTTLEDFLSGALFLVDPRLGGSRQCNGHRKSESEKAHGNPLTSTRAR